MTISVITLSIILVGYLGTSQISEAGEAPPYVKKEHVIEMSAVEMPDGIFAYRMDSHTIDDVDVTATRYGADPKPSIPGPTIVITETDTVTLTLTNLVPCDNYPDEIDSTRETPMVSYIGVHVHGVHYEIESDGTPVIINKVENSAAECGGGTKTYDWIAVRGTQGTWPYHDHTFMRGQGGEDVGLLGTLIVNPQNGNFPALIDGKFKNVKTKDISKEYILWMTSTETLGRNIFYGVEIDNENGGRQTPLWVNPVLIATEGDITRWHILGMGDEFHSFHLHAHRWIEPNTQHIIDVEEIAPLDMHVFAVKAGEGVGPGDWMYHCHVFEHMEQGMSSIFRVLPADKDDTLPEVGAVFGISDEPGLWFKTLNAGVIDTLDPREGIGFPLDFLKDVPGPDDNPQIADSEGRSLAVILPGQSVLWSMKDSETKHTITSIIWPSGAEALNAPFQFDKALPVRGSSLLEDDMGVPQTYEEPGLYVYTCKIHPYMFAAVLVEDTDSPELDVGDELIIATRTAGFPTFVSTPVAAAPNLATALLTTFFVVTDPSNWKDYTLGSWEVNHPPVDVTDGTASVNLSALDVGPVGIAVSPPGDTGVGEVWVDTQFERTVAKNDLGTENDKPGTVTVVDASDWSIERKIAFPEIDMNHPHNMWSNTEQSEVYQTQWFDKRMVTINQADGTMVKDVVVGESPSHVMTAPSDPEIDGTDDSDNTGKIFIAMNGEEQVLEVDPNTLEKKRQISTGVETHPHGHWISPVTGDGKQYIVTPNFFTHDSTIIDISVDPPDITRVATGLTPIATGMMPDGSKYYTADFLHNQLTKIDTASGTVDLTIDLLAGPTATGLPIQTPVSPDGRFIVTANVLFSKITVVDTSTDTITKVLDCDPGCHGVQWGAKSGGDYFAYVSNKFSNALIVVDPDPDGLGAGADDGSNAVVAGTVLLAKEFGTEVDDRPIDHAGMGGQGILSIPNVYRGWIQDTVDTCGVSEDPCTLEIVDFLGALTPGQRDP